MKDPDGEQPVAPASPLPRLLGRMRGQKPWAQAQPFQVDPGKVYPGSEQVPLPRPAALRASFGATLWRRRSRAPAKGALRLRELATLLWCMQGQRTDGHRTSPSAGALYPLEVYVQADRVDGLRPALYHYRPPEHGLERIGPAAPTEGWCLDRFPDAAASVVLTAVLPRLVARYDQRAYRFALLEAGHACQTLLLGAAAQGLAALPVGGFYDDRVHRALGIDGVEEVALYVVPVGRSVRSGLFTRPHPGAAPRSAPVT